jgi:hypothetical protein
MFVPLALPFGPSLSRVPTWVGWLVAVMFELGEWLIAKTDKEGAVAGGYRAHDSCLGFHRGFVWGLLDVAMWVVIVFYIFPIVWPAIRAFLGTQWTK